MKVPFLSFDGMHQPIKEELSQAFNTVLNSNWFVLGEQVKKFEQGYAAFNEVAHCVGVSNGLDAIYLALKILGIGAGDEVIVPSNTYIATVLAVSYLGATPILVEPDENTCNISPANILKAITRRTRAIIPVHLYGQICDMTQIMAIANDHNLFVVEDNAQSHGARQQGKISGSFGHINATSFYPGKNLGALGDAGAVTTNSDEYAQMAKVLRNYGSEKKYYNEYIGHNMRIDELQAALLQVKLKFLQGWTQQRRQVAATYNEALMNVADLVLPFCYAQEGHVYHLYVVRTAQRDALQAWLAAQGVGTLIHYPVPPHLQAAYAHLGFKKGDFPLAEEIANTCLSLPMWPGMTNSEAMYVAEKIAAFYKK